MVFWAVLNWDKQLAHICLIKKALKKKKPLPCYDRSIPTPTLEPFRCEHVTKFILMSRVKSTGKVGDGGIRMVVCDVASMNYKKLC